jgi:prepilin-type N-terminal cleavage/methylation domain-containing protein
MQSDSSWGDCFAREIRFAAADERRVSRRQAVGSKVLREGAPNVKRHSNSGFSLIEILIVIAIALVLAGIAIPAFSTAMNNYRITAAVSATTGAIQSTRFQAIMHGCEYQLVFTPSTMSYQIFSAAGAIGATACLSTPVLVTPAQGSATTPIPSVGPITATGLVSCTSATSSVAGCTAMPSTTTTITYSFYANGTVTLNPSGVAVELKNSVKCSLIGVTGVGYVSVFIPTPTSTCP